MRMRSALCAAVLLAFTASTWCADKPAAKKAVKAAAKPAPKKAVKAVSKPAAKASAKSVRTAKTAKTAKTIKAAYKPALSAAPPLRGKTETLTCRDGTEDRHARIGVVLIGGKVDSFAYYSKWKPRTCSIYLQRRHDPYSKWLDKGNVTNVNLERGLFLIEHDKGAYRFVFRDIDRERYCGMDGTINGTLTVRKGSEHCEVAGIMEEGEPLGQAYANLEQAPAATAPVASAPEAASPPGRIAQRYQRGRDSPFPTGGYISD